VLFRICPSLVTHVQRKLSPKAKSSGRWKTLLKKDDKWIKAVNSVKIELQKFEAELKKDEDLNKVKETHEKFGMDMEEGLVEAETGMQATIEKATWFWQSLFEVCVPRVLSKEAKCTCSKVHFSFFFPFFSVYFLTFCLSRTEYKDDDLSLRTSTSHFPISSLHMSVYATSPMSIYSPPTLFRLPLVQ
jgi:hypothetical protein